MVTQFTMDEHCFGVGAPWSAQVDFVDRAISNEFAVKEDKTECLTRSRSSRGDIRVDTTLDSAIPEYHCCLAEDEIRRALNITFLIFYMKLLKK